MQSKKLKSLAAVQLAKEAAKQLQFKRRTVEPKSTFHINDEPTLTQLVEEGLDVDDGKEEDSDDDLI